MSEVTHLSGFVPLKCVIVTNKFNPKKLCLPNIVWLSRILRCWVGEGKKEIDFAAVSIREGCPMPDGCGARSNTDIREFFYRY